MKRVVQYLVLIIFVAVSASAGKLWHIHDALYKAVELGDPLASYNLGYMYENGITMEVNTTKAIKYYEQAVKQNYALAQYRLGALLYYGNDQIRGIELLKKAAENNVIDAQLWLGQIYRLKIIKGRNDRKEAHNMLFWYKKAAKQGSTFAQFRLGEIYDETTDSYQIEKSCDKAKLWYEKAAMNNYDKAQLHLGKMYRWDGCLKQDPTKSYYWIQKAVENGNESAFELLSGMLNVGEGLKGSNTKHLVSIFK